MPHKDKAAAAACRKRNYDRKMQDPEYRQKLADTARRWRKRNPDKTKVQKQRYTKKYLAKGLARLKAWREKNKERAMESDRQYSREHNPINNAKLKADMIAAYGGCCECCGESEPSFLTIDHKYPKGHEQRGSNADSYNLYRHLKFHGWPKDSYRLVCYNCNCSQAMRFKKDRTRGVCPHEQFDDMRLVSAC